MGDKGQKDRDKKAKQSMIKDNAEQAARKKKQEKAASSFVPGKKK